MKVYKMEEYVFEEDTLNMHDPAGKAPDLCGHNLALVPQRIYRIISEEFHIRHTPNIHGAVTSY
jgi:hypothetical protein|uniref:Uncharacterized protein n=1 Tax=Picea glauca TaxID=3330 RepID=A0A101M2P4_PICGL|nr:hypothetical protein ABT39_MTgene2982 [Picea glauca]